MKVLLDGVDITADILKQSPGFNLQGGVFPNASTRWFNFLAIAANHPELKDIIFSQGGLHSLTIEDDPAYTFEAKLILRLCYSARNS